MKNQTVNEFSAIYLVNSNYMVENKMSRNSYFSVEYHLGAKKQIGNPNYYTRRTRSNVALNEKPVSKLMDIIMLEIGNSIYPLDLDVDPNMYIVDIFNYDIIKESWLNCTKKNQETYQIPEIENYIKLSAKNISDKESLIDSLYSDTFINLYFRNIYQPSLKDESCMIIWPNFPIPRTNRSYLYKIDPIIDKEIKTYGRIFMNEDDELSIYRMDYKLTENNIIESITGFIQAQEQSKIYTKQIDIKTDNIKIKL